MLDVGLARLGLSGEFPVQVEVHLDALVDVVAAAAQVVLFNEGEGW